MRIGLAVAVAAVAGIGIVPGAGAGGDSAGLNGYLRSLGVDPATVVVQRGARNYAGPDCPGRGWSCTKAKRVVQVSTSAQSRNKFECTPSSSTGPDSCVIVQTSPGGANVAVCREERKSISLTGLTQSCSITQTNTTGPNEALTEQELELNADAVSGTQHASVHQTNVSGSNSAKIVQRLIEDANAGGKSVAQDQTGAQEYAIDQDADTGANTASAEQILTQRAKAPAATTGTQTQHGDLTGALDQFSHGVSTMTSRQSETQTARSKHGGNVTATQVGPQYCCSTQADNPDNTFTIVQEATQLGGNADQSELQTITYSSSGDGEATQTSTQNGETSTQTESGSTVTLAQTCSSSECTSPEFAAGDVFVSVGDGKVQWHHPDGTLVKTLDTGQEGFTTGLDFGPDGNLYVTDFSANDVSRFDPFGNLIGSFGSGYDASPESVDWDTEGHLYVGQADGTGDVLEFDLEGAPLASFDVAVEDRGSDHIDLAADDCTLYYTSEGTRVLRFDICTSTQLADFASEIAGPLFAVRLLPDGGALVAATTRVARLNALGVEVQEYDVAGEHLWFALDLAESGTSFWAADMGGAVVQFDLVTGSVLASFDSGSSVTGGVAVR